jgi:hypothetical protein
MFKLSLFSVLALAFPILAADPPVLQPNKTLEAEITRDMRPPRGTSAQIYAFVVPVKLKAGQALEVDATVVGERRIVQVNLIDPTGRPIAFTSPIGRGSANLHVARVNASGDYKILVGSDQIGLLTVTAKYDAPGTDVATLRAKIERTKKELAEMEAELKALESKKP